MDLTSWIRSRAATGQPLNIHAVARERPDLLELAFAGPTPRGWRRSLMDAGVDPYKIVHAYETDVECAVCGMSFGVLGTHLKTRHEMLWDEYVLEFGPECKNSSEGFRATQFRGLPIAGIAHWERLWSSHYVIDWILRLHEKGHPLNHQYIWKVGNPLVYGGRFFFGSWDAALLAAGLDPARLRVIPPHREWTRSKVIEGLRSLAKLKKTNWRRQMSNSLRCAMTHFFDSPQEAARAAGLAYQEINSRAIFSGKGVDVLVADIRALENLKGRERRRRLDAIYHKNKINHQIVVGHFGSLRKLAAKEGIALRLVAPEVYRDEADVQHDLDLLEHEGMPLTFSTLKNGHKRLYNVIRETGWGAERLKALPIHPAKYPPCNPRSGLLQDRMIILRRRLRISMAAAASKAGLGFDCWSQVEKGEGKPKAATIEKIERLLEEHGIPLFAAPHTPVRSS